MIIVRSLMKSEPSVIVKHPSDGMKRDTLDISLGQHLRLSCKATGIPSPNYQWYRNNIELREQQSCELDVVINRYKITI